MWSKMAVLRVLFDLSKHFSRSTASRCVYLLPSHITHTHDVISCLGPSSIRVSVLQELAMWSKMAVLRVLFDLSKHSSRSAESRHAYLLPPHAPYIDDVTSCVSPLPYHFGVDPELVMWSKMAVLRVFLTTSKHFSRSAESKLVRLFTHPTRLIRASSDDMCFPCLARCCRVALARRGVQNGCFSVFFIPHFQILFEIHCVKVCAIYSCHTSHILMMSRHALPCRLTSLASTRSSPRGQK